jgi:hypothetical protein
MSFSDETLMKYADGELEGEERAAVESAVTRDVVLAARVEAFRRQRAALRNAFDGVLVEPVPERLVIAARLASATPSAVADLDAVRARRAGESRRASWPQRVAIAASLVIGILIGQFVELARDATLVVDTHRGLMARGNLAASLNERLSGTPSRDSVTIGFSYRTTTGDLCRTFAVSQAQPLAGIACREGNEWQVRGLSHTDEPLDAQYRMAGVALPEPILQMVDAQIEGEPLDAVAEAAARERQWRY